MSNIKFFKHFKIFGTSIFFLTKHIFVGSKQVYFLKWWGHADVQFRNKSGKFFYNIFWVSQLALANIRKIFAVISTRGSKKRKGITEMVPEWFPLRIAVVGHAKMSEVMLWGRMKKYLGQLMEEYLKNILEQILKVILEEFLKGNFIRNSWSNLKNDFWTNL